MNAVFDSASAAASRDSSMATDLSVGQVRGVRSRLVWDWPLRAFHWLLVLAFIGAYVTHRLGIQYFRYHLWCGYAVTVLVAFRLVWGVIGTRHARFIHFLKGPRAVINYLRGTHPSTVGHNPLGALMVVALLLSLAVQAVTGLFANDEILNVGPLYGWVTPERSLVLTSLHRQLFYWIAAAVAVHVLTIVVYRLKNKDLTRAMLTGHKPDTEVPEGEAITSSRGVLALVVVVSLIGLLAWLVISAPAPVGMFDASFD